MNSGGYAGKAIIVVKLITESISFALQQLRGDKLRTFLSLFGVTIGIFTIVAIFTAVDALKENTKKGLEVLGSDVVIVGTYPISPEDDDGNNVMGGVYKWWEYMRRPSITEDDYNFLKAHSQYAGAICRVATFGRNIKHGRNAISRCYCLAVDYQWREISHFNLLDGRYFTPQECDRALPVAIVGYDVAQSLFGESSPIDKIVKIGGSPVRVIGVIEKRGESMVSIVNYDNMVLLPIAYGSKIANTRDPDIYLKPRQDINKEDFIEETRALLRNSRRLAPGEKNNFSVSEMTFITSIVDEILSTLSLAGLIIAGFSLLIGGFGIANIMFVSVKERTHIIGIQKALGAKRYFILSQFLAEAVFLSILGGLAGILLVVLITMFIPQSESITINISFYNIISGISIATLIGVVSGIVPAMKGASLNAVEAINSK